jgi:hypothetical protein
MYIYITQGHGTIYFTIEFYLDIDFMYCGPAKDVYDGSQTIPKPHKK